MKLAVQLYSVREDAARDFVGTLERLAALGIDGVEFAGYHGLSADALRGHLDRLGLVAASTHVVPGRPGLDFDAEIEKARVLGCSYLVDPYAVVKSKGGIERLAPKLARYAKKVQAAGLGFGYHNHAHECFRVDPDGRTGLDLLLELTEGAGVFSEPDTHWLQRGKVAPRDFLRRHAGRVPIVGDQHPFHPMRGDRLQQLVGEPAGAIAGRDVPIARRPEGQGVDQRLGQD